MKITAAICAFNAAGRLGPTLDHLARQAFDGAWELILVDNRSTDGTASFAQEHWAEISRRSLSIISEPRQGLAYAREAAVSAAQGDIVLFIDDDNWLAPDYLARLLSAFEGDPQVVAVGGRSVGIFEVEPGSEVVPHLTTLAVGGGDHRVDSITGEVLWLWGAGLGVRRSAVLALERAGFKNWLPGRLGGSLVGGEDTALTLALRLAGGRLHYDDDLLLEHWMPRSRLTPGYIIRLARANGQGTAVIDLFRDLIEGRGPLTSRKWVRLLGHADRIMLRAHIRQLLWPKRLSKTSKACERAWCRGYFEGVWALRKNYASLTSDLDRFAQASKGILFGGGGH